MSKMSDTNCQDQFSQSEVDASRGTRVMGEHVGRASKTCKRKKLKWASELRDDQRGDGDCMSDNH